MERRSEDYGPPYRIASWCPECTASLRLRHRRADGAPFLGCSDYPRCNFAEPFEQAVQALGAEIADLEAELAATRGGKPPVPIDLAHELRGLIALAHPDRWPHAQELAHAVTSRLTELRARCAA